ncbi:MAG: hypothetical protein IPF66_13310 [Holophagales bacterium]|nr:hypothetical protein [Holophagales bacterium]
MTRLNRTKRTLLGVLGIAGTTTSEVPLPEAEAPLIGTKDYVACAAVPADERFAYGAGPPVSPTFIFRKGLVRTGWSSSFTAAAGWRSTASSRLAASAGHSRTRRASPS